MRQLGYPQKSGNRERLFARGQRDPRSEQVACGGDTPSLCDETDNQVGRLNALRIARQQQCTGETLFEGVLADGCRVSFGECFSLMKRCNG